MLNLTTMVDPRCKSAWGPDADRQARFIYDWKGQTSVPNTPVGQFAIRSAFLLGEERVIAIDIVPGRLQRPLYTVRDIGDVQAIAIDPITDFFGGLSLYREDQIRCFFPLNRTAKTYNLAILSILYMVKDTKRRRDNGRSVVQVS